MGGFHSLYISAYYPNKFGYVGLFSAATSKQVNKGVTSDVYENLEDKLAVQFKMLRNCIGLVSVRQTSCTRTMQISGNIG